MKKIKKGTEVEPAPPAFATTPESKMVPFAGVAGRVVKRYFMRGAYWYDVRFTDKIVVKYHHSELRFCNKA
jgi:hypothetical protein